MGFPFVSKLLHAASIYCVCASYGCFSAPEIEIRCLAGSEISIQQAGGFCIGNFASKGRDAHESKGF